MNRDSHSSRHMFCCTTVSVRTTRGKMHVVRFANWRLRTSGSFISLQTLPPHVPLATQAERQAHEIVYHSPPHNTLGNRGSCARPSLLVDHSRAWCRVQHIADGQETGGCLRSSAVSVDGFAFFLGLKKRLEQAQQRRASNVVGLFVFSSP